MLKTLTGTQRASARDGAKRPALRLMRRGRGAAVAGAEPAAAKTFDEFGQRLHLFASVLTEDPDLADQLVIQTILAHEPHVTTLRDLSAGVYVAWVAWGNSPLPAGPHPAPEASTSARMLHEIHGLCADQRAALGLCKYGDHTYRQAAELLGLAPDRTARLLCEALRTLGTPRVLHVHPSPAA